MTDLSLEVTYQLLPLYCIGHTDQLQDQVGTMWEENTQGYSYWGVGIDAHGSICLEKMLGFIDKPRKDIVGKFVILLSEGLSFLNED